MQKISLQSLGNYLATLLKVDSFSDSCENGLQIPGQESIQKIGFAVSASQAAIEEAVKLGVEALIVHHGLFWNKERAYIDRQKAARLKPLLEKQISLLAYHLPLDAHPTLGNNWKAALDLGWEKLEPFGRYNGISLGVKGSFAPIERELFISKLESYFDHAAVGAFFGKKNIESAAFVSGGAYNILSQAIDEKVDIFITGNFDEPAWWLAQEAKIHFAALGHYATEKTGVRNLQNHLAEKFGIETHFIDLPNPF